MKKKYILWGVAILGLLTFLGAIFILIVNNDEIYTMEGTIISIDKDYFSVQDDKNVIYTFKKNNLFDANSGDYLIIQYSGLIDSNNKIQDVKLISYDINDDQKIKDNAGIPINWNDHGIFSIYYKQAYDMVQKMSLEEKIGQLLIVSYPDNFNLDDLNKYYFGGFIFNKKDFSNRDISQVQEFIKTLQEYSKIPLLTGVNEEGGDVVSISDNPNLIKDKFKSVQDLYGTGGFNEIKKDTIEKNKFLRNLGININLAPVVDVSTNNNSYIYDRSLGMDSGLTAKYARTVIESSKDSGVSYVLKHFPGYGDAEFYNNDNHIRKSFSDLLNNDIIPFKDGIDVGAEAILVNHIIYDSIDDEYPASLSKLTHNILRNDLGFNGIVITNNLNDDILNGFDESVVLAILAGNDMIIVNDYKSCITEIKKAINEEIISEDTISKLAFRIIAWKYYKGLIFDNQK